MAKFWNSLAILEGLFSIWQIIEHTWLALLCNWKKFHCCKWPNTENLSSHLVTLGATHHRPTSNRPTERSRSFYKKLRLCWGFKCFSLISFESSNRQNFISNVFKSSRIVIKSFILKISKFEIVPYEHLFSFNLGFFTNVNKEY